MTAWEYLDQCWKDILSEKDENNQALMILKMINHLHKVSAWESDHLENLNEQNHLLVRDLIIEHLELADQTKSFFEAVKPLLGSDPENRGLREDIGNCAHAIEKTRNDLKLYREQHRELLQAKETLAHAARELEELQSKVKQFREIKEKATPQHLERLRNEVRNYEKIYEKDKAEFERAESRHKQLSDSCAVLEKTIGALNEEANTKVEELLNLLEALLATLIEKWDKMDKQTLAKTNEINQLVQQYLQGSKKLQNLTAERETMTAKLNDCLVALEDVVQNVQKARELYKLHFSANERAGSKIEETHRHDWSVYSGKLEAVPEAKMREELKAMHDASERIKTELEKLDETLRQLLELNRKLRDGIRDLSDPSKTTTSASA